MKKELQEAHDRIAKLANRITMQFDKKTINVDVEKVWQTIAPSVESIECALNGDDCTVLNVFFREGGIIEKHKHDRQEEIFVVAGEIYDSVNDVQITQGDRYIIPANTYHQIESDYARLTVVFRPPFPVVQTTASQL